MGVPPHRPLPGFDASARRENNDDNNDVINTDDDGDDDDETNNQTINHPQQIYIHLTLQYSTYPAAVAVIGGGKLA